MPNLSLEQGEAIAAGAFSYAEAQGLKPLTIMVLDSAGIPVLFKRSDGSPWLRFDIALGKAWGCLAMGTGGRALADRLEAAPALFEVVNAITRGRIVPSAGGVLVRGPDNEILGAAGVSGDHPDNDELAAIAGCAAAGLVADNGVKPLPLNAS